MSYRPTIGDTSYPSGHYLILQLDDPSVERTVMPQTLSQTQGGQSLRHQPTWLTARGITGRSICGEDCDASDTRERDEMIVISDRVLCGWLGLHRALHWQIVPGENSVTLCGSGG